MQTRHYIEGYTKPILDKLRSAGAKYDPNVKKWYTFSKDISESLQSALNQINTKQTQAPAVPGQVRSVTDKICRCGAVAEIWAWKYPICSTCYAKEIIRNNASQMQPDNTSHHWDSVSRWAHTA